MNENFCKNASKNKEKHSENIENIEKPRALSRNEI